MRGIFTIVFISSGMFLMLQAQTATFTGSIKDKSGKAVIGATINLLIVKDSVNYKQAISDKNGSFEITDIKEDNYIVTVSSIGFQKLFIKPLMIKSGSKEYPPFILSPTVQELNTVVVKTTRPFIETKIDKTIVNVEASPGSAGASALEVLEKSPGITVDQDGNISLKGKAGVIVMMDGKQTYLSSADLANMLKNMPASALDQIEIMSNPSAKYDASGNSGIINIKTKKGRAGGFNGSIVLGASSSIYNQDGNLYFIPKSQNSFTFNYHKNRVNLFGNYNPNFYRGRNLLNIDRKYVDANGDLLGYSDLTTHMKFGNNNHYLKLGLDYDAGKKDVIGVVTSGFTFMGHPTPQTVSNILGPNNDLQSQMVSLTTNRINFKNFTTNANWKHSFDTSGKELTADLDYVRYDNTSRMLLTTDFYDATGISAAPELFLKGYLPSSINIYTFKSDFTQPFKNGRVEGGVKFSHVKNDNLVDYQRELQDKSWIPDSRTNHFVYNENINAAYININRKIKKWSMQGGLRLENTVAKGFQVTNDSTFKRNFTNLFPSAFINYEAGKNDQITVSYSRRITRPNYQDLNPFTYFLDSLTYRVGNPYLLPQFTNNLELGYTYKSKYIVNINYTSTTGVISQILKQNTEKRITYNTSENLAGLKNMGISVTIPLKISNWWNMNLFSNIYNNHYTGIYNNSPIDLSYTSFTANITNSFTLAKDYTAELSGFYRSRTVEQLAVIFPFEQMTIAFQKQILNGMGTLRLNVRDPFAWQKFKGFIKYNDVDVHFMNRPDLRQVTATFTWRFGKNNQQSPLRRRSGSSQDEQSRIGQGGQ